MARREKARLDNKTARDVAVNCLLAFEREGRAIQDSLEATFQELELVGRDKRLAAELAMGGTRQLIRLDQVIKHFSSRKMHQLDTLVKQILRVGL